jgi:phage terminase Nu1 subunit (DNA packaging protein)
MSEHLPENLSTIELSRMLDIRLKRKKLEALEKQPQAKRDKSPEEVADILSLSTRTVQKWVKRGCPHDMDGNSPRLDVSEVVAWVKASGLSMRPGRPHDKDDKLLQIRIKKEQELLERYQRENKMASGLLIDAAEEERRVTSLILALRNKFCGLGASLAATLAGLDAVEIQSLLDGRVDQILREFASGNVPLV